MNIKILIAGLLATIGLFLAGYLIYGLAMADYFSGTAAYPGLTKAEEEIQWIFVGNLLWGILLAWLIKETGRTSFGGGAGLAAIVFFLFGTGSSLVSFAQLNLFSLESALAEGICMAVMGAVGGAIAGFILGRQKG